MKSPNQSSGHFFFVHPQEIKFILKQNSIKKIFSVVFLMLLLNFSYGAPNPTEPRPVINNETEDIGISYGTFNLINSITDLPIATISDGDSFALSIVGDSLNIQAIPSVAYDQVRFITAGYTHTEGISPYAYQADTSGDYRSWTPALGSLSFTVEYLNSGTVINTDTFTITFVQDPADTQAPTAPTLSSTGQTDTTVDLSWSGAMDNIGVTGYKIFKDGTLEATLGSVTSYQVTGLAAQNYYEFTITALDAAGNESSTSNMVAITTNATSGGGSSSGNWTLNNQDVYYNTGNVGIGTTDPGTWKLAVNGNIRAKEVKVETGWADYVFKKEYDLPSLEEVEKHIKEKGHLINIPSAKEVKANGIELGEMNKLLLEKIEELTLYILEQQKKHVLLENRILNIEKHK